MSQAPGAYGRDETELERYDRNLTELMGELRVALPGVQVLFGFLLVAPFNARFGQTTQFERRLYFLPPPDPAGVDPADRPHHAPPLEFRQGRKVYVVDLGNRLIISGLAVLAVAMTCAIALVTHYLFGQTATIITTIATATAFGLVWFALPLQRRRHSDG